MTYHGKVHTGGPPAVRELTDLVVTKVSVGLMDNNAYVLGCRRTGELLLVDAAADPSTLLELVPRLRTVVTTHRHPDHWQALVLVVHATGATTVAGRPDAAALPVPVDRAVWDGDVVTVGAVALEVVGLVGHTPGSVALLYDDPHGPPHLWTGDALFPGGVGRTGSPEDFDRLYHDVTTKIFDRLPDETWVYPGHGDDTWLGRERPHLAEWRARGW
jgi:glyoxylase-like metal-dependent hydrolase (beta-lactamase superfamily II)